MHPTRAIATCAVAVLAMVFSVGRGENGPLLLYKMDEADSAWIVVDPATVNDPAASFDFAPADGSGPAGKWLNLQAVSDDIDWRRDTAEKLRQLPVGPRF